METSTPAEDRPAPTSDVINQAIAIVEQIADDRGLLALLSDADRKRLMSAAGRVSDPDRRSRKKLLRAFKKRDQAVLATQKSEDDVQLAERLGVKVRVVEGSARNLKITLPGDLAIAESWLANEGDRG